MTNPAPRWANRRAACKYLGVSDATFYRYAAAGVITRHAIGSGGLYDLNQIDDAIRARAEPNTRADDIAAAREQAVTAALDTVRARIPTGKPLIPVAAVLEIIDGVAAHYRTRTDADT